jgi:hypothetical protein
VSHKFDPSRIAVTELESGSLARGMSPPWFELPPWFLDLRQLLFGECALVVGRTVLEHVPPILG